MGGGTPFLWYYNGRPLFDGAKTSGGSGSIRIRTEGIGDISGNNNNNGGVTNDWTEWISRLEVLRADSTDAGNYTCAPWRGKPASVSVFISQGKFFILLLTLQ